MKSSDIICSIDANIILRYLLNDNPDLYSKAREILLGVESGKTVVKCDPVNLAEVVWVLSSYYKLSNEQIVESLEPIIETEGFLLPDKERYLAALRLFKRGVKHFGDACACAVALQDCGGRLYSFDAGLSDVQGLSRLECIQQ